MLKAVRDFFWPVLEKASSDEVRSLAEYEATEVAKIRSAKFEIDPSTALTIATKIYESEEERAKSAETKSYYFLLVTAALVPLLTYLGSAIWDGKFGTAPRWLSLSILLIAILYLLSAAYWASRAISVRTYHTIGASDLASIWASSSPVPELVKEVLVGAVRNQTATNDKVSAVKMGMAFLIRTICSFVLLTVVQVAWEISVLIRPHISKFICG
jgi:hypothetical protein